MYFKKLIYIFAINIAFPRICMADVGFCFESQPINGDVIKLKFLIEPRVGHVRYKNGSSDIEIEKVSERSISSNKQMPMTIESKWKEGGVKKITGYYYLTTTGANVGELVYIRSKDKKQFYFFDDRQNPELNCGWD